MAIEMLYEKDGSMQPLKDKTIAVIGFGSQGHAHGLNARDSGLNIVVANRKESANGRLAAEKGLEPIKFWTDPKQWFGSILCQVQ